MRKNGTRGQTPDSQQFLKGFRMIVLGISFGHDAAACLIVNGNLVADAAEERFTRIKHDAGFPIRAIRYCLAQVGMDSKSLNCIAFAGRYLAPGMERYLKLYPEQLTLILNMRPREARVRELMVGHPSDELPLYVDRIEVSSECRLEFVEHHLAHAAAAHHTRRDTSACVVLTLDGIGDNVSVAAWRAEGSSIEPLAKWGREASLGWFYGIVTEALGWQHGDGEGTTMGLAAYGDPKKIGRRLDGMYPIIAGGNFIKPVLYSLPSHMNDHGNYHWHFHEAGNIKALADECGAENVAARAQEIIEKQVIGFAKYWLDATGLRRLACAGGLFLNVKLNQHVWSEIKPNEHWIFPNPGDAGLAMGAALRIWAREQPDRQPIRFEHLYLGPSYEDQLIKEILDQRSLDYEELDDPALYGARLIAAGHAIGWFQGRMESGPRALGNRSILMRADQAESKNRLNSRVKFREDFRPFCPSLRIQDKDRYLKNCRAEEFMMTSFDVLPGVHKSLPGVVHVDATIRPQMVRRDINPLFYDLINHVGELTGTPLVLNTSFNVKGEPIVCHPREALRCFFDTGLDALILGRYALVKPGVHF